MLTKPLMFSIIKSSKGDTRGNRQCGSNMEVIIMFNVNNVLTVAFNQISANGYVKKTVVNGEVWRTVYGRKRLVPNYVEQEGNTCRATLNALKAGDVSCDETLAHECVDTYRAFVEKDGSDFGRKVLSTLAKIELDEADVMQVAFVPVFYFNKRKHDIAKQAREQERMAFNNSLAEGFYGEVSERVNTKATLIKQSGFDGAYGFTNIYTFLSDDKHVLVWFTTAELDISEGEIITLQGKVKGHKEYNGTKQTIVTRCKVLA